MSKGPYDPAEFTANILTDIAATLEQIENLLTGMANERRVRRKSLGEAIRDIQRETQEKRFCPCCGKPLE